MNVAVITYWFPSRRRPEGRTWISGSGVAFRPAALHQVVKAHPAGNLAVHQ
jgi:hypothetical protein